MAYRWIWNELKRYRLRMAFGLLIVLACSVLAMVNPYISGTIVDQVILGKKYKLLMSLLLAMSGAALLRQCLRYLFQMIFENVSQTVLYNIKVRMYTKLQMLDFSFFDKNRTGDIMNKLSGDTDMVRHFVAWVIYNVFENLAIFICAIIFLLIINWRLTLILLPMVFLSGYFNIKLAGEVKPTFFAIRNQLSNLNSVVQENISGNRVVKAFAKEQYEVEKFTRENQSFKQKNLVSAKVWGKYLPLLDSLTGVLIVALILAGGIMVIRDWMTMGELVAFSSFIWALNNPMRMSGWLINDIQRFAASGEKIIDLLKTEPLIKNAGFPVRKERLKGEVEFKNVCFSYGQEEVLEDINLKIEPGQTVAIIGPTGSGKSTLISLISRFYDCNSGQLLIDGVDIREIDIKDLRRNIALAMQDIFLFSDTIEGNIAYGAPDASLREVESAAETAKVTEFIADFPERYDTIIGERGVGLSGGQKQRIALARALLKNPSLLILDDTTSNVDMETEYEIQKQLNKENRKRTTIIIAQRISSVKNADQIVVLDKGHIIERGKHEELLRKKGYYYSVFANQYSNLDMLHDIEVS